MQIYHRTNKALTNFFFGSIEREIFLSLSTLPATLSPPVLSAVADKK